MTLPQHVVVLNTLGGTLAHYSRALTHTLDGGDDVEVHTILEPSASGGSAAHWILAYFKALWRVRGSVRRHGPLRSQVLVTWPVLGYLDLLVIALVVGTRASVDLIMHDPKPLVRAVGYDPLSRVAARIALRWGTHGLIVHSDSARRVVAIHGFDAHTTTLPHPLLPETADHAPRVEKTSVVRVLGQYKADRDLTLMREIARASDGSVLFEVHGRGWPDVEGWSVKDRFVSEQELDELIRSSGTILLPYRRFFQSGIAIRCLEQGIPVVGLSDTSLADLYPDACGLLVSPEHAQLWDRWLAAAACGISMGKGEIAAIAAWADRHSRAAWRGWLDRRRAPLRARLKSAA